MSDEHITKVTVPPEWMAAALKREACFKGQPPTGPCENCGKRPAKNWWSGKADFMAVNRGAPIFGWCALCCVEGELEHAKSEHERLAKRIPELEAELEAERARLHAPPTEADGA